METTDEIMCGKCLSFVGRIRRFAARQSNAFRRFDGGTRDSAYLPPHEEAMANELIEGERRLAPDVQAAIDAWCAAQETEARRIEHALVRDFVKGAHEGDGSLLVSAIGRLEDEFPRSWPAAMRAITRGPGVPIGTRRAFLLFWIGRGDHLRGECRGHELTLADGLKALLPRYTGPALTLYRGESTANRRRRTYGLSWSATAEVGRAYATGRFHRTSEGGSVLLEAQVFPDAIICAPVEIDDRYGEQEYVVDRRRLRSVKVIERFSQMTHAEFRAGEVALRPAAI
jgi:hypothetical protein